MNVDSLFSGQNRHTQAYVLHESLVERHQFKIACLRERCRVRVGPNVCRECAKLSKDFQRSLYVIRFVREGRSVIVKKIFVELPRFLHRDGVHRKGFTIRRQPQKTQLSDATKADTMEGSGLHPALRQNMTRLRIECERQPEIYIGRYILAAIHSVNVFLVHQLINPLVG